MTGNSFHCTTTSKPAPHFKRIDYDPWAQLEFKHELTGADMKEKQALEERNMMVTQKMCQWLREDKEVQGRIRQIQTHSWVRVVEGQE